jgi:hypothetical protein
VALTQEDPVIEGATLEPVSGLAAVWHWCPSRAQIDADDRYTLTLAADDSDNPKVPKNYLVVLAPADADELPGHPPVITHTAMNESTIVDLTIDATVTDDIGLKQPPLLYYSTTAPATPPDLAAMTQVTMILISGTMQNGVWAADVPNPVADPAGRHRGHALLRDRRQRRRRRHRHLRSRDPGPGHRHLPDAGHQPGRRGRPRPVRELLGRRAVRRRRRSLRARRPDRQLPAGLHRRRRRVPHRLHLLGQPGELGQRGVGRQCVPTTGTCAMAPPCEDDIFEDNDTRAQAAANLPDLDPATYDFTSCPLADGSNDDEDWFPIILTADATVTLTLAGMAVSDLDLVLYDGTAPACSRRPGRPRTRPSAGA